VSRLNLRLMLPLAGALLLGACSTVQGPPSVPTASKTGQSWVVTRPLVAAQVLDTCSRPSPGRDAGRVLGYWAPSRADVDRMEAQLAQLQPQLEAPQLYDRQYVGIDTQAGRRIYVNAFRLPDGATIDPAREAIRVCDGGRQFWGAVYDPQRGRFDELQFNGG